MSIRRVLQRCKSLILFTLITLFGLQSFAVYGGRKVTSNIKNNLVRITSLTTSGGSFCSGLLLLEDTVVTAAHCLKRIRETRGIIVEGSDNFMSLATTAYVSKTYSGTGTNDLALLILHKRKKNIVKILLPSSTLKSEATSFSIFGYANANSAYTGITDKEPSVLNFSKSEIKYQYEDSIRIYQSASKGTCDGDSGGPVLFQIENQTYLYGVLSRMIMRASVPDAACMLAHESEISLLGDLDLRNGFVPYLYISDKYEPTN